jgi:hypothetical protein
MSDLGYRSIEVQVNNYVNATLEVQNAIPTDDWVDGEEATEGQRINRDQIVVWGAKTDESPSPASFTVKLSGLGGLTIVATNGSNGRSGVVFRNVSDDINPTPYQEPDTDKNHTRFIVDLTPVAKAAFAKK